MSTSSRLLFMDDAFCVNRFAATQIVTNLLEAWTPDRKQQITQAMREHDVTMVEHVVIGDYDLALWKYPKINAYAASINSGQEDPTSLLGQEQHPRAKYLAWHSVAVQLHKWVSVYGRILISSGHRRRIGQYQRLLSRFFLTAVWSEYPDAGFFILPD